MKRSPSTVQTALSQIPFLGLRTKATGLPNEGLGVFAIIVDSCSTEKYGAKFSTRVTFVLTDIPNLELLTIDVGGQKVLRRHGEMHRQPRSILPRVCPIMPSWQPSFIHPVSASSRNTIVDYHAGTPAEVQWSQALTATVLSLQPGTVPAPAEVWGRQIGWTMKAVEDYCRMGMLGKRKNQTWIATPRP